MNNDKVREVALAIAGVWRSLNTEKDVDLEQVAALFEPSARAAIEAMRVPTNGMENAGTRVLALEWEITADGRVAGDVWRAMIDDGTVR